MTIEPRLIEEVKARTDMVLLIGSTVALKKRGNVYVGLCPNHREKTPSFKVDNDRHTFKCFACDFRGDAIDWVRFRDNCGLPEAVEYLSNGKFKAALNGRTNGHAAPEKAKRAASAAIMPVPDDAPEPSFDHPSHGKPTSTWTYRNAAGQLLGYVSRYDPPGDRKVFSPRIYTADGWRMAGLPKPRPLYGLEMLAARPDAPVLVTEGERDCDSARLLLPGHVVVTWHGGAQAVKDSDWSVLKGRSVTIWPDADDVGATAGKQVAKLIGSGRVLTPPTGVKAGWGATDALEDGWDTAAALEFLREPEPEPVETRGPMPEMQGAPSADPADMEPDPAPSAPAGEWPFALLGHRHGTYFYLPNAGGTVIALGGASHSKNALMMLAPLYFWETAFSAQDKKSYDCAANALIHAQHRQGIYDPTRLRGRGAWWDDGRVVIHLGDRLIVNGEVTPIKEFKTDFLYEVSPKIRYVDVKPLANSEARQFIELCKMLSWERPIAAYLLAGWCALAPICGALAWRPNVLLSGAAGSGKTWIYHNIICRVVGPAGYALAANVSEPGIRRALGSDAMPVMIDELESKGEMDAKRIESIMGLMRYSSSETDAMIVKGSNSGAGVEFFKIRSMFCTVAIGSLITDYADATRNTVLSLRAVHGTHGEAKFKAIEDAQRELLTDAWIDRLRSRIIGLIPVIRRNAETFSLAGARVLGTRRLGDQMGTLLAGAYALTSREEITTEAAQDWIEKQDWSEEREIVVDTDGPLCFQRIMEHTVMCETRQGNGHVKRSLGELVTMIAKQTGDETVGRDTAVMTARRCGVLYQESGYVAVSNTHSEIGKILHDTPWSANWHRRLKAIKGALSSPKPVGFSHGAVSRAILVPWASE